MAINLSTANYVALQELLGSESVGSSTPPEVKPINKGITYTSMTGYLLAAYILLAGIISLPFLVLWAFL